ncbi:MAG: hypothetical protein IJW32_05695 [Clostridia bacterium]|nr:hypothetical protein [Clostridia bacterium]
MDEILTGQDIVNHFKAPIASEVPADNVPEEMVDVYRVIRMDELQNYEGDPQNIACAEASTFYDNPGSNFDYRQFPPEERLLHFFLDKNDAGSYWSDYEDAEKVDCTVVNCQFPQSVVQKGLATGTYRYTNSLATTEKQEVVIPVKEYSPSCLKGTLTKKQCGIKIKTYDPDADYYGFF